MNAADWPRLVGTRPWAWLGRLVLLGCALPIWAQSPADSLRWIEPAELAVHADSLTVAPQQRQVKLTHSFVTELLVVRLDGQRLEAGLDFDLIAESGTIVLRAMAEQERHLYARYRFDPLGAPSQQWLHDPARSSFEPSAPPEPTPGAAPAVTTGATDSGQDLLVSGSKSVSVQGGTNREAVVDQALRLSVSGKLTEGIDIRAEISDENLPITPEGNTEELSELDQVRIELSGARGGVLLGDFAVQSQPGAFVSYERKLQGLSMRLLDPRGQAAVLAGAPQGERVETEFRGREGVQGPYELLDGASLEQVYIVAGSERVWLDGALLARGESRDYTIDYARATVRFSERLAMGPERRIAVDFETTRSGYSRSVLGGGVDSVRVGRLRLAGFILREADDPDRPSDGALSTEDRDSLAQAGDDPSQAFSGGIVVNEAGAGRYDEAFDGGGNRYFVLADSTRGEYDLYFTRVDSGAGDYVLDRIGLNGLPEYRYVGAGLGDHVLGRRLALPESLRQFGMRLALGEDPQAGWFRAESDFSQHDENQLSLVDDADNGDVAWRIEAATPWLGESGKGLRALAKAEAIGADFASSGRIRAPFFYDRWNLQDVERSGREGLEEAQLLAAYGRSNSKLDLTRLHRGQEFDGRRADWQLRLPIALGFGYDHNLAFMAAEREAARNSDRRERQVRLGRQGSVRPHASVFDERWTDEGATRWFGHRRGGASLGADVQWRDDLSTQLVFTRELADSLSANGSGFEFEYDSRRWQGGANWHRSAWSLASDVNLRDTRVPGDSFERARMGNLRLSRRGASSSAGFDFNYRAGTDESRVQQREILFVGINNGDYDAEGQPVGVRQGDYTVIYTPSDSLLRATEVEVTTTIDLPLPGLVWGGHSRTFVQVRERNQSDDLSGILFLSPDLLRNPDSTVFGEQRLREELQLLGDISGHDLRAAYEERLSLDQRFAQGAESSTRRQRELRYELGLRARFSLRSELGDERRVRDAPPTSNPQLVSYDTDDRYLGATLRWRADERRRLAMASRWTWRDERSLDFQQQIFELTPSADAQLLGGRLSLELRWAKISEENNAANIRPYFFEAPGVSRRLGINGQWELGAYFTVSARYQLRDEAERILRQDLALETRARF